MNDRTLFRLLPLFLFSVLLSGCVNLFRPEIETELYDLKQLPLQKTPCGISVRTFLSQTAASYKFCQTSGTRVIQLDKEQWVSLPGPLLGRFFRQALAGNFQPGKTPPELSGSVLVFDWDLNRNEAVLETVCRLQMPDGKIREKRIRTSEKLQGKKPADFVDAMSKAAAAQIPEILSMAAGK